MVDISSIITGGLALVGVIVTNIMQNNRLSREFERQVEKSQAITDVKIDELTREVREHNNFAKRLPVVEEQIKVINHRIADLKEDKK